MKEIQEKIRELIQPILDECHAFLVDMSVRNDRTGKLVQAFVDTDKGITIDECAHINRGLGRELDRLGIFQTPYRLEVSSPGLEKPLSLLRQYNKNIGRRLKVAYRKEGATATFVGTLVSVREKLLEFRTDADESVTLDLSQIIESKVELPW